MEQGSCCGRFLGGASSCKIKCGARPGLGEAIPQDEVYAKIERSEVFLSRGKVCPHPDVECTLMIDAWRERNDCKCAHTHTHI